METLSASNGTRITEERIRTNLLKYPEQKFIAFLCRIMPAWVSPDGLTLIGFIGSCIIAAGFALATIHVYYLFLSIGGFAVQWFGDSLDGRIAYYRNSPRKWYGFSLDLSMDWISTVLIGVGFYIYMPEGYKILVYIFIASYGWSMILALLKYKLTDAYSIDVSLLGPTELRIALCLVLTGEIFLPGSIKIFAVVISVILLVINSIDFYKILQLGNRLDQEAHDRQLRKK